jgi:hypothetical protein
MKTILLAAFLLAVSSTNLTDRSYWATIMFMGKFLIRQTASLIGLRSIDGAPPEGFSSRLRSQTHYFLSLLVNPRLREIEP